jgi:hypothetical protein
MNIADLPLIAAEMRAAAHMTESAVASGCADKMYTGLKLAPGLYVDLVFESRLFVHDSDGSRCKSINGCQRKRF